MTLLGKFKLVSLFLLRDKKRRTPRNLALLDKLMIKCLDNGFSHEDIAKVYREAREQAGRERYDSTSFKKRRINSKADSGKRRTFETRNDRRVQECVQYEAS